MFGACEFAIHAWAVLAFLEEVPSLVLHMPSWELLGAAAYTLTFALLESLLLLLALIVLAFVLPASLLRHSFAVKGTVILSTAASWVCFLALAKIELPLLPIRAFWAYCLSLGLAYALLSRFSSMTRAIEALLERLSVLSNLYVMADLIGLLVVVARNI